MADKKPGRGGHGGPKKKGRKEPKLPEPSAAGRKSNKREKSENLHRLYEGKVVTPVKYRGAEAGKGNYVAAMLDGVIVEDESGKPIPYHDLPLEPKKFTASF